jgi:hypothetical protein
MKRIGRDIEGLERNSELDQECERDNRRKKYSEGFKKKKEKRKK